MLLIIRERASNKQIAQMEKDLSGYIKIVVDIEREILAGGGERHFLAEKELLDDGSKQKDLWGGGIDWETKEIDYNSIINLRPNQDNPSRDILSSAIRKKFDMIVKKLFL